MNLIRRQLTEQPFFSVCIPQHNRTSFLLAVCRSLDAQTFRDFEVCISDDCSTDGRQDELLEFLHSSRLSFVYRRLEHNLRYDGNLRSAIELASAPYCFLLGNDDAIKSETTFEQLHEVMTAGPEPAVVLTNFEDYSSGKMTRRVKRTAVIGSGAAVAASHFRKFSFVSGVILQTAGAQAEAEHRWDGSEMHQMFVGCRLIAAGGVLREVDLVTVCKDVQIPGELVDSYARKPVALLRGIPRQMLPLRLTGALVLDAIEPHIGKSRSQIVLKVIAQYLGFLYPYWLLQYRKVQSWRFAAGLSRGMRPRVSLATVRLSRVERLIAQTVYGLSTLMALAAPIWLLDSLEQPARRVARTVGEWGLRVSRT